MLDKSEEVGSNDIAIVGMALRVPGARNIGEFWSNLRNGVESVRDISDEELKSSGEPAAKLHHPNYVRRTADLPDMEMFDAEFFGMSPKEAAIMDPQHRHFLECAWEAMEDAGITPDSSEGPVGVFAGSGMGSYFYFNVCSNKQLVDQVGMFLLRHTGNDKDFLATRTSFALNLHGPSVNIQTACSTSLVAVHYACQSLLSGECDMALAGGVTIEFPHRRGYIFQPGEILSPDGHCRPFDHRAAGTVFGSGVGVVALRRASDAIRDGDIIHAIIKGTAVNNDGASKASYLAPSVTGQAEAIIEAQGLAGVSADSIGYVECHGTGTPLGDPIEVRALTEAFRQTSARKGYCRIGSVKSNIGHLDTAAGVVGLIKASLALKHGEIPPTVGFEEPNKALDIGNTPFVVADRLVRWPSEGGPRRAAVNSLGVGGTNAHAILQEAPPETRRTNNNISEEPLLLLLSSRQKKGLARAAQNLSHAIAENPHLSLSDTAYTLLNGRKHFEHRLVLAVSGRDDALTALSKIDSTRAFVHTPVADRPEATFVFPGGGIQHPGMGANLYRTDAQFRASVDEGLSYLPRDAADEIRSIWFASPQDYAAASARFLRPSMQLPAILILEVAMARLWMRWGIRPTALIGHSMGENAAACISGVMSFQDAVALVRLRGELFDTVEPGGMLSVSIAPQALKEILPPELDIASINAPELCVVSGTNDDLDTFEKALGTRGIDAKRVPIDIAAHSRMLDAILPRFRSFLQTITLRTPLIPIVSNRSGNWLTAAEATDPDYWVNHLRSTVLFSAGASVLAQTPNRIYIDVGPGKTLSSLLKQQGGIEPNRVINSLPHVEDTFDDNLHVLGAIGRAWATGLPVSIDRLWEGKSPRRVTIPTYAFQQQRYFLDRVETSSAPAVDDVPAKQVNIEDWGYKPSWKQSLADYTLGAEQRSRTWLVFVDEAGVSQGLVVRLRAAGHRVVTVSNGDTFLRRSEDDYILCPELGKPGYAALLQSLATDGALLTDILHMWLVTSKETFRPGSNFFHRNQECGFYSILHLAQAIGDSGDVSKLNLIVATNGMQRVFDEAVPYPEKSTVLGPSLVLPKEMAGSTVRLVDVVLPTVSPKAKPLASLFSSGTKAMAPDTSFDELHQQLWEDILATPSSETVAYRNGRRWTRTYERLPLNDLPGDQAILKQGGVYMFTGGLGELALDTARQLATRYGAKLVLIGRTELPARDEWVAYERLHGHDTVRRAISAIRKLEELGAAVLYLVADVSNPQAIRDAVSTARTQFGGIDGVFHTAGVVDDDLMQLKTEDSIERVLAPKTLGTAVLNEALADLPLDFLILFSSTSTDTAPAGQADYVAANAYLNAFAESCASRKDRKTIAVHWGVWADVGLAARATATKRRGDVEALSGSANGPLFQRWVEDEDGTPWLETTLNDDHWMLNEHRLVSGQPVMPGTGFVEMMLQVAREYGFEQPLALDDVQFVRPLTISAGRPRIVRARLEPAGWGYRVIVQSAVSAGERVSSFEEHAEGSFGSRYPASIGRLDIPSIEARCPQRRHAEAEQTLRTAQEDHIRFGPRWSVLKSIAIGDAEAIAELKLNAEGKQDLEDGFIAHPALLDIATGFAIGLADAYGSQSVLWAPVEYGSVIVYGPLPSRIFSWARLVDSSEFGEGYAAFDIRITDADGTVVLDISRFVMKQLNDDLSLNQMPAVSEPSPVEAHTTEPSSPAQIRFARQVQNGIRPQEGFDALLRALATGQTQPIISSMDLEALRKLAAEAAVEEPPRTDDGFERPDLDTEFVEPRNPVETAIADYWKTLLGVSKVGIHDNFFDLGGHSLIAVRLFRMIKKDFAVDFPISALFEAPTISKFAALIQDQVSPSDQVTAEGGQGDTPFKATHLVLMSDGKSRSSRPVFICAGMFGNVLNLRHLALALGQDRPVYGLQARGLYGDQQPHETFEEMARDYIAEIRTVQAEGPYLLAGYSGGGIAAYEIARQLQADGQEVAKLVMIDTPLPTQPRLSFQDRLMMKFQDLQRHKSAYLRKWIGDHMEVGRKKRRGNEVIHEQGQTDHFNNERIEVAFRGALRRYQLHPYAGQVTLLRPKPAAFYHLSGGRHLLENRDIILPDNGWSPLLSDLTIVEVPGDHNNMVLQPNASVLSAWMRKALNCDHGLQSKGMGEATPARASAPSRWRRQAVSA